MALMRSKRSRIPGLTTSLSWMTPSTPRVEEATTSGVPPSRATGSTRAFNSSRRSGSPSECTHCSTESVAPLRSCSPAASTPLMRVSAVNGTLTTSCGTPFRDTPRVFPNSTMERPSGVSSPEEARQAACIISSIFTPGRGRNAEAMRLPSVIVPVLSSSSTSTSPAASTARPDRASTLRWSRRSIPAMPMAASRPLIVVGMRHTSSATSTTISMLMP